MHVDSSPTGRNEASLERQTAQPLARYSAWRRAGDLVFLSGVIAVEPRTATIVARTQCDLFVLKRPDFSRILRDHHQFAETMTRVAKERYDLIVSTAELKAG